MPLALALALLLGGCTQAPPPQEEFLSPEPVAPVPEPTALVAPAPEAASAPAQPDWPGDDMGDDGPSSPSGPEGLEGPEGGYGTEGQEPFVEPLPTIIPAEPGELNIGLVLGNEAVLHPLKCAYRDLISLNELVFESVIDLDENQQPVGELAEQWSIIDDKTVFTLRKGVVFHSGEPLTAQDVVESYAYIRANGQESAWYERTSCIKEMTALDERTLQVTFTNGGYAALYAMTFPVVQRSTLSYALPKGTGPYWYIGYAVNRFVRIEANPLWWKKPAKVGSIVGWRYTSTENALNALFAGEIDTLATRSAQTVLYKTLSDYTTMEYSTLIYEMLVPNLDKAPMKDLRLRKAIMHAIDRTAIGKIIYGGMVQTSEVPVVPGTYLYEPQAALYSNSPERALTYLHEMGLRDTNGDTFLDEEVEGLLENFTIRLVTSNEPNSEARAGAARLIAQELANVGITVEVEVLSKDKLNRAFKNGDFDIALIGVNLSFVPDLSPILRNDGKLNKSGYADKTMNNLLKAARNADNAEEFIGYYARIQRKISEDLPIMGLYFRTGSVISQGDLTTLRGSYELNPYAGIERAEPWK